MTISIFDVILHIIAQIIYPALPYPVLFRPSDPDAEYYTALNRWTSTHYGYEVEPSWVTLGCGVVYGLATGVKAFTEPGDAILIQQPVYYPFREVIEDNGRSFINSQLHY